MGFFKNLWDKYKDDLKIGGLLGLLVYLALVCFFGLLLFIIWIMYLVVTHLVSGAIG